MFSGHAALGWALLVCQLIPSDALARSRHIDAEAGDVRLSFLSAPENQAQQAAEEPSRAMPQEDNQNYDGTWTFTGADCPNTGAVSARIIGGKIFVRQVDPDDTLHSVRAGNGSASVELPDRAPKSPSGDFRPDCRVF